MVVEDDLCRNYFTETTGNKRAILYAYYLDLVPGEPSFQVGIGSVEGEPGIWALYDGIEFFAYNNDALLGSLPVNASFAYYFAMSVFVTVNGTAFFEMAELEDDGSPVSAISMEYELDPPFNDTGVPYFELADDPEDPDVGVVNSFYADLCPVEGTYYS